MATPICTVQVRRTSAASYLAICEDVARRMRRQDVRTHSASLHLTSALSGGSTRGSTTIPTRPFDCLRRRRRRLLLFQRLRLPSVVGLLAAGMLVGPHALGFIHDTRHIQLLAEVGVIVLLFAVGLEFSLPRLAGMSRLMAVIGAPQVLICVAVAVAVTAGYFSDVRPAVLVGMLVAMSSTAVVFKLLTDRGELTSPQSNVASAVLLFQDLLVVVFMVLLPVLAGRGGAGSSPG
jgi:hypothetical protein